MVNEADAALHSANDDYDTIRVVGHITEYLADGEHLTLTDRPLLSNSDAAGNNNGNDPTNRRPHPGVTPSPLAFLLGDSVPKPLGFTAFQPE
jgi:hypothetical protein